MRTEHSSLPGNPSSESEANTRLRADLGGVSIDHGDRSARIVIDDIGGRFARIPNHLWDLLVSGKANRQAWQQATAAGWTRRSPSQSQSNSNSNSQKQRLGIASLLAIRIPLFNVDFIARHLSASSDWIFAAPAVRFWVTMMIAAAMFALSQYREIAGTIGEMPRYFSSSGAWVLGSIFVGTKLLHELGHAIACRRTGVRCGNLGLIFFCGVPCPFCDVTQLWRHPRATDRAAVMLAGMYVEGILATLATFVWALADDGPARLHAMNVMIVCSVSTLLFNANPLMRYDGYYVLSDLVGSVNLRSESRNAFANAIQRIVSRKPGAVSSMLNRRTVGLVIYYLASSVYRYLILITIAAAVLVFADSVGIKLIAAVGILGLAFAMTVKAIKRSANNRQRSFARKMMAAGVSMLLLGIVLLIPIPRHTTAHGFVDAANATEVFLGANGVIESVHFDIGQTVVVGQELARVRDHQLAIQSVAISGQLKVASYRTRTARRQTLDDSHSSKQLDSLEAVESALQANLVSLNRHRSHLSSSAPVSGIVLPTWSRNESNGNAGWGNVPNLSDRLGMRSDKGDPWCRIAADQQVCIVLRVNAKHRESVSVGMIVRGHELQSSTHVCSYRVLSISPALTHQTDSTSSNDAAMIEVLCEPTNDDSRDSNFLSRIGGPCKAVIRLPSRSIGEDVIVFLTELLT
ncbi:Peptidase family M50 [Rubripirellula obstinata]|uniref:Peptidase family M50 n=1 Tax=Rubripirellula obstinata TaxID=406547 RepID=A0A5B1CIB7_9BACT|nr:hypothetical protein [Rubripirellula obstinata]KAA1259439.1 Peptidase family M50 [Rubripirellula obstinata]